MNNVIIYVADTLIAFYEGRFMWLSKYELVTLMSVTAESQLAAKATVWRDLAPATSISALPAEFIA